ncbi:MAG TPA: A24 family peptidase [Anaerolineae bacterium]|nr:A24 family peptidase [Anaerolineae bacterium]
MILLVAFLGLLIGGLINLLADQLPRWRRVRRLPFCPECETTRPAWQWLATVATLGLRTRCPHCGKRLPWRHVLVELGTAALMAFVWLQYGRAGEWAYLALYSLYSAILVLVLVIDLEHKLILNVVMLPAWALALAGSLIHPVPYFYRLALLGGVVAYGLLYVVYQFGVLFVRGMSRARGKEINAVAFGFGDVRLGGFMGLALGFPQVLHALFIAILLGGVAGLLYWFVRALILRRYALFTAIPYGPYLVTGTFLVMFLGPF